MEVEGWFMVAAEGCWEWIGLWKRRERARQGKVMAKGNRDRHLDLTGEGDKSNKLMHKSLENERQRKRMTREEAAVGVGSFEASHNFLAGENQRSSTSMGSMGQAAAGWS